MSTSKVRTRSVLLVLVLELVVGAWIWFSNSPVQAQPASAPVAETGSSATPTPASVSPEAAKDAAKAAAAPAQMPVDNAPKKDACPVKKKANKPSRSFGQMAVEDLLPIGILIVVITLVLVRLPKVELGHSNAFRSRRLLNWLPLGLTYSFLYFARYNIKQFQGIGLTEAEYGTVFGVGSAVYGLAFLLNGPLTDRWGGRATILHRGRGRGRRERL